MSACVHIRIVPEWQSCSSINMYHNNMYYIHTEVGIMRCTIYICYSSSVFVFCSKGDFTLLLPLLLALLLSSWLGHLCIQFLCLLFWFRRRNRHPLKHLWFLLHLILLPFLSFLPRNNLGMLFLGGGFLVAAGSIVLTHLNSTVFLIDFYICLHCIGFLFFPRPSVAQFLDLCNVETIHVVNMWVEPSGESYRRVESLLLITRETRLSYISMKESKSTTLYKIPQ